MLGNMSGVSVNCVSFHQCAVDCVSEGKVLGIESHLDVALALGVCCQVRVNLFLSAIFHVMFYM